METRNAQTSLRYHSAHICAKFCTFSFCVGVFNKNANTKDARKRSSKSFCHLLRTPAQQNFKQKRVCFLRLPPKRAVEVPAPTEIEKTFSFSACRAWWQGGERCIRSKMSFSPALFVARHGKGGPGGNVRASFLATSWGAPRSSIKKKNRERAQLCERPATKIA